MREYMVKITTILSNSIGISEYALHTIADCPENAALNARRKLHCKGIKNDDIKRVRIYDMGYAK